MSWSSSASDPDLGATGGGARDSVGVADRHQRQVGVAGRALDVVVADAPAGGDRAHLDDLGAQGQRRSQALADAEEPRTDADEIVPRERRVRLDRSSICEVDDGRTQARAASDGDAHAEHEQLAVRGDGAWLAAVRQVGPDPDDAHDAGAFQLGARADQPGPVLARAAAAMHPRVELEVDAGGPHPVRSGHRREVGRAAHRQVDGVGSRQVGQRRVVQPGEQRSREARPSEFDALADPRDAEPGRPGGEAASRDRHGAVAERIGLDDGHERHPGPRDEGAHVGPDR